MLPKDPIMLLSFVNTKLRDQYVSLDAMCEDFDITAQQITQALSAIGYQYDKAFNQFKSYRII